MRKTIIVTGASAGIGRATAERFLEAGWCVGLLARRADPLHEIARDRDALVLPCDVTRPDEVERAFSAFLDHAGRIDALFNNAGRSAPTAMIDELDLETWRAMVDVNLTGMFLCARAAFARMRQQEPNGGRIINNGSISAHAPRPGTVPYTATKHAVTGLTKSLSLDGRPWQIACGQIDIGNAATEMTDQMGSGALQPDGTTRPEPRMKVEHVADAVLHMAELPLEANVQFMTVMASAMPYIGRG